MGNTFDSRGEPRLKELSHEIEMGCWWYGWDRVLFGDEPPIVFTTVYCFLVLNFEFYFLQGYCTKVALLYVIGTILLQYVIGNPLANLLKGIRWYWQSSGKFFIGWQRSLATL
jgi:uncharacterized membrane protein YwzB